jgi:hypothetical protein
VPSPPEITPGPDGLRRATATDLPALKAVIDAAYTRYLTRMDKPPAPMLRDYGPSVTDGTTWVTGSPINQAIYARLGYTEVERRAENGYRRIFMEKRL